MMQLTDPMGRAITYLRVSLTEQCNLRCGYCYGPGDARGEQGHALSDDDLLRLIRAFAVLGISKVRFTGGEPLVRPGLVDLVRRTSEVEGVSQVGLTTNGLILKPMLRPLIEAGLNCLNISLDTLSPVTFERITGVDGFERVYSAIIRAEDSRAFERVKVNTVIMRGINDGEIQRFALWAISRRIDLRFIEFMPTGESGWGRDLFVGEDEIRNRIDFTLTQMPYSSSDSGPAASYGVPGAPGRISFISAVSRCFCEKCNRLRLTSRGDMLGCLYLNKRISLRRPLERGASVEAIAQRIREAVVSRGFRRLPQQTSVLGYNPYMRKVGG